MKYSYALSIAKSNIDKSKEEITLAKHKRIPDITVAGGYAYQTKWDGFVIQNGRTQIKHNRDGAAGVALRYNGVIENCVVKNNINKGNDWMRGAGVFCNDGTIINCQITNNELYATGNPSAGGAYGGGIYMRSGVTYNSCITNNEVYRLLEN